MSTPYNLTTLAEQIYDSELMIGGTAQERSDEIPIITSWLEAHVGELNTLLNTNFVADSGEVDGFKQEESAILREMYVIQYYKKQSRSVLRQADDSANSLDFSELREGDSVVKRSSKRDHLKDYKSLISHSQDTLNKLISNYNTYQSPPSQVVEKDSYN
tara:strand:- start:22160 stop:22636 length:477 start_codon:yes stop_codon:yes gene_type:complete